MAWPLSTYHPTFLPSPPFLCQMPIIWKYIKGKEIRCTHTHNTLQLSISSRNLTYSFKMSANVWDLWQLFLIVNTNSSVPWIFQRLHKSKTNSKQIAPTYAPQSKFSSNFPPKKICRVSAIRPSIHSPQCGDLPVNSDVSFSVIPEYEEQKGTLL